MGRMDKKTRHKLAVWVAAGLISPQQAEAIERHESHSGSDTSWGILIFAGFGAVVLGLGVILLFAYNWAEMHKFTKLGIVFGSVTATHAAGLWLSRTRWPHGVAEAAHMLGSMLFGAGIWLVAQIYHISAHYPNAFLIWAAGAILLAWALPSTAQGILGAVLLCIWACAEAMSYSNPVTFAPLLILATTGSLAWVRKSPTLLTVSAVSFTIAAVAGLPINDDGIFQVVLTIGLVFSAAAWMTRGHLEFPSASPVLRTMSLVLYLPCLFILTFLDAAEDLVDFSFWEDAASAERYALILLALAAVALTALAVHRAEKRGEVNSPEFRGLLCAPLVIFLTYTVMWWTVNMKILHPAPESWPLVMTLLGNAVFIYHTVAWLWIGCRETRRGLVVSGSLMLAIWTFARFTDLFDSLLARGAMFMAMGGALFLVATMYHRQRARIASLAASPATNGMEG